MTGLGAEDQLPVISEHPVTVDPRHRLGLLAEATRRSSPAGGSPAESP